MASSPGDVASQPSQRVSRVDPDEPTDEVGTDVEWAETAILSAVWPCPVCGVENTPEALVCRVCRAAPLLGAHPDRAHEDSPAPATLWKVVPLTASILVAGVFFAGISPAATPWSQAVGVHGRYSAAGSSRVESLRRAVVDVRELATRLQGAIARGDTPPPVFESELAYVRARWAVYGDAAGFPGLRAEEQGLSRAFEDLSSATFQARNAPTDPMVARRVVDIIQRIKLIEESLQNVP